VIDRARLRELLARRRIHALRDHYRAVLARGHLDFPEQAAAWRDRAELKAILCSRRAGKTKGGCEELVAKAASTPGGRYLYVNTTADECERVAWFGLKNDGLAINAQRLVEPDGSPTPVKINAQKHSIHFANFDSWIYLKGADDENEVRKALGLGYHEVWWDEAQKIPSKLAGTIREVLTPALLDFGGGLTLTGTPVRNMAGLFYDATRPDAKRRAEWTLHQWNLLDNPFFGATREERMRRGLLELQKRLGGEEVAPLDGPIMRREGLGLWTTEDAAFTYAVNKVDRARLLYAPHRRLANGFPDFAAALLDLPGWGDVEYFTGIAADIGFDPDPFAVCAVAWNLRDPNLYELGSWSSKRLDSDQQAAILREVRGIVKPCFAVADAGGSARPTVAGWEKEWVRRYGISIEPIAKAHKNGAIERFNSDVLRCRWRFRDGSPLIEQLAEVQWATVRSAGGKLVEDPSIPNDVTDAGLYAHRRAFHFRYKKTEELPEPGTSEWDAREEEQMLRQLEEVAEREDEYEQLLV
jgi:hypothetical protein